MSLDFYLKGEPEETTCFEYGSKYLRSEVLFEINITHNLNKMADKAGIYEALWHPEAIKAVKAKDITGILEKGLEDLKARPDYFRQFNAPNGWGLYEHLVSFVEEVLEACKENPEAYIKASV